MLLLEAHVKAYVTFHSCNCSPFTSAYSCTVLLMSFRSSTGSWSWFTFSNLSDNISFRSMLGWQCTCRVDMHAVLPLSMLFCLFVTHCTSPSTSQSWLWWQLCVRISGVYKRWWYFLYCLLSHGHPLFFVLLEVCQIACSSDGEQLLLQPWSRRFIVLQDTAHPWLAFLSFMELFVPSMAFLSFGRSFWSPSFIGVILHLWILVSDNFPFLLKC